MAPHISDRADKWAKKNFGKPESDQRSEDEKMAAFAKKYDVKVARAKVRKHRAK